MAQWRPHDSDSQRSRHMGDFLFLGLGVLGFAALVLYVNTAGKL